MKMPMWVLRLMHRSNVSRPKLRGGFLHSKLGDRMLDKALWRPTPKSLARAWLVGFPITMVPFLPFQTLIAAFAAFFVRGNLIFCIAIQFLSNPFTAAVQLPACYIAGELVRGRHFADVWHLAMRDPKHLVTGDAAISLFLGSFVLGAIIGAIGYAVILQVALRAKKAQLHAHGNPPPPAKPGTRPPTPS